MWITALQPEQHNERQLHRPLLGSVAFQHLLDNTESEQCDFRWPEKLQEHSSLTPSPSRIEGPLTALIFLMAVLFLTTQIVQVKHPDLPEIVRE